MKILYMMQILLLLIGPGNVAAGTMQQQMLALAATGDEKGVVVGKDGWLFLKDELEHLGSSGFYGQDVLDVTKTAKPEFGDPLPAIVDFNNQLKEQGIELIFVPIPPKALIYPDKLPGSFGPETTTELGLPYSALYAKLAEQGVHVLDLIPIFRTARTQKQVYCRTDTHFSGLGLALVADEVGKIVKKSPWYPGVAKKEYNRQFRTVGIRGDLAGMQKVDIQEDVLLEFITDPVTGKAPLSEPTSPVLLLGDSHTLVFSVGGDLHSKGAGLFDHLTAELGFVCDLLGVRGSGATASRIKLYQRSRKENAFVNQKKTVIWCLSAREFTGSGGWRKIPVAKIK